MQQANEKKRLSKGKIALIVIASILLAVMMAVGLLRPIVTSKCSNSPTFT